MSTQVKWRRGTTEESDAFTGALAEITVDTDEKTLRVHDNVTPGGSPLANKKYVTGAQEELLPSGSQIYPRSGYLSNGMTVTAGTTHLRVLVDGKPTIVAMSPVASGVVSLLTEAGATIGAIPVDFYVERTWLQGSSVLSPNTRVSFEGRLFFAPQATSVSPVVMGVNPYDGNWRLTNGDILDVRQVGKCVGYASSDDTIGIEYTFSLAKPGDIVYFPQGSYGVKKQCGSDVSNLTVAGAGKYHSDIRPVAGFDHSSGNALIKLGDGTTTSYISVKDIACLATYENLGNNLDGLAVHSFYNADILDCRLQGGNYSSQILDSDGITLIPSAPRETGGLNIIDGRHTRVGMSQFHNGYCHGITINEHLNGLVLFGNAFDETSCHVKSFGNILEMTTYGNEHGSAIRNPVNPAPSDRIMYDLRVGVHGLINIGVNNFSSGGETEVGILFVQVSSLTVSPQTMQLCKKWAIAGDEVSSYLSVSGVIFRQNGTDGTEIDPTLCTNDPLTSPYCGDLYLEKAFLKGGAVVGCITDITNRPSVWIEGNSLAAPTSNVSIVGGNVHAFTHGVTTDVGGLYYNGNKAVFGVKSTEAVITGRTITRGVPQFGNVSVPGVKAGQAVTVAFKDAHGTAEEYNLVVSGHVNGNNIVRWVLVNTSDTPVTITDKTIVVSAINA